MRELAEYADTASITEDKLLIGLLLQAMRREEDKAKTMQKNPATFDEARKFILELETARQGARAIGMSGQNEDGEDFDVDWMKQQSTYKKKRSVNSNDKATVKDCSACGRDHGKGSCPAAMHLLARYHARR